MRRRCWHRDRTLLGEPGKENRDFSSDSKYHHDSHNDVEMEEEGSVPTSLMSLWTETSIDREVSSKINKMENTRMTVSEDMIW